MSQTTEKKPQELITLEDSRNQLLDEIKGFEVTDDATRDFASNFLPRLRGFLRKAEEVRKGLVSPLNDEVSKINGLFRTSLQSAKDAEQSINRQLVKYQQEQIDAARKEQERLQRVADKRQERAESKGETPTIPEAIAPLVDTPVKTIKTDGGSVTFKTVKKWRWARPGKSENRSTSKLPDMFWIANEKLIDKAVKAGTPVEAFMGEVFIYEEQETMTRQAR